MWGNQGQRQGNAKYPKGPQTRNVHGSGGIDPDEAKGIEVGRTIVRNLPRYPERPDQEDLPGEEAPFLAAVHLPLCPFAMAGGPDLLEDDVGEECSIRAIQGRRSWKSEDYAVKQMYVQAILDYFKVARSEVVEVFATEANHRFPVFWSKTGEVDPDGQDGFSFYWGPGGPEECHVL